MTNHQKYLGYVEALKNVTTPVLALDLDALDANIDWAIKTLGKEKKQTIRLATKSLRSPSLIKKILTASPVFKGLMSYHLEEALWLRSLGFDDILMGYPCMDQDALKQLSKNSEGITLMVDLPEHLELLQKIAVENKCTFSICMDVDLSLDLPGLRFGVYRSSLHSLNQVESFLIKLKEFSHLKLTGMMGYEAQIAGVGDKKAPEIWALKKISLPELKRRRKLVLELIQAHGFNLSLVNGGGTGSLITTKDEEVTEITLGSAFYAPHLFDHYRDFTLCPAMFFGLPVTRHPIPDIFTCFGGGYIASGSVDKKKLPLPYLPEKMELLHYEGAGEVQTPFRYHGTQKLNVGDMVFFRHAKAAEICERFSHIHLVRKNQLVEKVLTYRGEGREFG